MATIKSGSSTNELDITALKAAKVEVLDSLGANVHKKYDGQYLSSVEVLPSTLTAGTTYFSITNTGSKKVTVDSVELNQTFSGTAAASRSIFSFERGSTSVPTGGTALAPVKSDTTNDPTPSANDVRYSPAGLTITGVVYEETPLKLMGMQNQLASTLRCALTGPVVLRPGQSLAIRAYSAIVAGAALTGVIYWHEET